MRFALCSESEAVWVCDCAWNVVQTLQATPLCVCRPVTRGGAWLRRPLKIFPSTWKNVLAIVWNYWTLFKNLGASEETVLSPWCPKLDMGLLHVVESRGGYQGRRTRLSLRAPLFQEMPWGPSLSFVLRICMFLLMNHSEATFSIISEASRMFFKMKQKFCPNVPKRPLNNFQVNTKNNVKSNDFKQCTMWNRHSRRSTF